MIIAICLLGIGWNLGIVSSTAIVVNSNVILSRVKVQSFADLFIAVLGSISRFISGVIVGEAGFIPLCCFAISLCILLIGIVIFSKKIKKQ